jgi:hypothetical protein
MKRFFLIPVIFIFLGIVNTLSAQAVSGFVYDMNNEPIPYANVYIRELQTGTTTDEKGFYYIALTTGGEFHLAVSSLGYESVDLAIIVRDTELKKTIFLKNADLELEEVVVRASKRDPAYAIIQQAIDNKERYQQAVNSYKVGVYVKAIEEIDRKEQKKREAEAETEKEKTSFDANATQPNDPFALQQKENQKLLGRLNMVEMQLDLSYQYPKKYKEERTAYKAYGDKAGLFIPKFGETDFNFYDNMVRLTGVSEAPVISPLSNTSILSYKFKLVDTKAEGSVLVHKIKVTPRKAGNSTVTGYIYINDGLWNINRVDFQFSGGALKFFDAFELKQDYQKLSDSLWVVYRQEFKYETKAGKSETFRGSTVMRYSDYQHNYPFPAKFFNNEVIVTTKEAYERDSTYWNTARPEALTVEQQKVVFLRDSISAIINSKAYQDSITAEFNKVTFLEMFWEGVGWRNNDKKSEFYVGSLPAMIDYSPVGGFRVGPFAYWFRRFESGKMVSVSGRASYGFQNEDWTGFLSAWHRYNPHRLADVSVRVGRNFQSINNFDAFINQLSISNYILNYEAEVWHRIELFNGFYTRLNLSYNDRKSVAGFEANQFIEDFVDLTGYGDEVLTFEDYQAFISDFSLEYTPRQRFMTEPNRKIILGSNFPTFTVRHKRGWQQAFGSDINFDYVELAVNQDLMLGQFGHTLYDMRVGDFLNTRILQEVDLRRFRRSDPYWYSNPLRSFQTLDSNLTTTNLFFEGHFVHHFNGTFFNNIPLVNRLKLRLVVGGGYMWLKDGNFQHYEVLTGLERVFKLGARRRLKLGIFGAYGDGNYRDGALTYKFSIDVIDTWKKDWSF